MFDDQLSKYGVCYPQGFSAAGVKAGIKKSGNLDLALIVSDREATVGGVFTTNAVAAACVKTSRAAVANGKARAIVANAGCANACTGEQGIKDANDTAAAVAKAVGCEPGDVVVASTGIIGVNLPMDKMLSGVQAAYAELSSADSQNAARAIVTTDTHPKELATEIELGGKKVRFGAIAKGSGMIQPNMATMLAFITTDAAINAAPLQKALKDIVEETFNMISIDGDMSTNDMAIVLANGTAGNAPITSAEGEDYKKFFSALSEICRELSRRIAADGEGATKFLTINVTGAASKKDAKSVAMSVAKSPLVKTAFFGEDPNWGRVVCAVGYADAHVDAEKVTVAFGGIPVFANGMGVKYDDAALKKVMAERDIVIDIALNEGDISATVWSCDFSYEYVKINGEYHT